jgi:glycosyltransferase involved in cell wall biosynthesis
MTNILYIASRTDIAGGEIYLLDMFKYLDRARFTPVVVVPGIGAFSEKLASVGIEYFVSEVDYGWLKPPLPWYRFLEGLPGRVRRLVQEIGDRDIDLVHTNSNMILEGALAARLAGKHHIHVVHIPYQENLPLFERLPLASTSFAQLMGDLSTRMVAVAEPVARSISPPVPREKIRVIHNGVDLDAYAGIRDRADGAIRAELGIPAAAPLVAGIGRLHPDKGFEFFVEAAHSVLAVVPEAHFIIAGAGDSPDYERALRARITELGLADRLHLAGFRTDVPSILAESDVFALTSRSEGGPYVLIEAMACGCACVASRCGGFVEYVIKSGQNGYLVNYGDAQGLATYLIELLRETGLRSKFVEAGNAVVFSGEFEVRNSVASLMSVYEDALALPAPLPGAYPVDLLLQAATEIGYLGTRLTALEERVKRAEHAADLLLDNPVMRLLRKFKR